MTPEIQGETVIKKRGWKQTPYQQNECLNET